MIHGLSFNNENFRISDLLLTIVKLCINDVRPFVFFSFLFFFFLPCLSIPRYRVRLTWTTLPLSRANICRYTLKRSETKRRRGILVKFWISTNLSLINIRLLVCRERLCIFPLSRTPLCFIGDFYDFFVSDFCEFDIGVSLSLSSTLSNDFSRQRTGVKSILSIEAEYVKYG